MYALIVPHIGFDQCEPIRIVCPVFRKKIRLPEMTNKQPIIENAFPNAKWTIAIAPLTQKSKDQEQHNIHHRRHQHPIPNVKEKYVPLSGEACWPCIVHFIT